MKAIFTAGMLVAITVMFAFPSRSSAQAADTVWVDASPTGNINNFIMGDTLSNGQRAHPNAIYALYQDSLYFYNATMDVNFPLTLVGEKGTGRPPVIAPAVLPDGSLPGTFIDVYKGNLTLKRLYMLGVGTNNVAATYATFINADSIDVVIDSCIYDGYNWEAIGQDGAWDNFYITNNYFKNLIHPSSYFYGEAFRGDAGNVPIDTIIVVNNTFFSNNGYAFCPTGYCALERFEHNTVVINMVNPLNDFVATNEEYKNNLFYSTESEGATPNELAEGYYDVGTQPSGLFSIDTLNGANLVGPTVTPDQRKIEVFNNGYYQPTALTNFYTQWNDTVTTMVKIGSHDSVFTKNGTMDTVVVNDYARDTITPSVFMNHLTDSLFTTKSEWPGLVQEGNINADPGFAPFVASQEDSAIKYVLYTRTGQLGTYLWYYNPGTPVIPQSPNFDLDWPLAENFAYTNTNLLHAGTDGFALGDLNWFPTQKAAWLANGGITTGVKTAPHAVPTKFSLSNNYPNPFNPSTEIRVNLKQSGVMSLKIYNVLGELVKVVAQGEKPAGSYMYQVNMDRFASGVYFYTLREGGNAITKKMVLLK